jgi:hypothetical protein
MRQRGGEQEMHKRRVRVDFDSSVKLRRRFCIAGDAPGGAWPVRIGAGWHLTNGMLLRSRLFVSFVNGRTRQPQPPSAGALAELNRLKCGSK